MTAVRNKLVVLPKIDSDLNCIYKSDVNTVLNDGDKQITKTKNILLKSKIQYTMINEKTVFVCVPPVDSFESTLTV